MGGACTSPGPEARGSTTSTSTVAPSDPDEVAQDLSGTVDIGGGRRMHIECSGTGAPTVVLVSGLRASARDWQISESAATPPAAPVFEQVAQTNRVCAYDRPGTVVGDATSRSDPTTQPTTAAAAAADLHATLAAAGEVGPFVLASHSVGGLIGRVFATTFPDDVAGIVLIDAPSEFLQDNETPEQWAVQRRLMRVDASEIADSVQEYPDIERLDIDATFEQLRAAPALRPMPLVVVSADELLGPAFPAMIAAGQLPPGIDPGFGFTFDVAQAKAQAQLAQLLPGAVHITETNSGHDVHLIQPQIVVDAIRSVVERSRGA